MLQASKEGPGSSAGLLPVVGHLRGHHGAGMTQAATVEMLLWRCPVLRVRSTGCKLTTAGTPQPADRACCSCTGNAGRVWRRVPHKCRLRGRQSLGPAGLLLVLSTQGARLTSACAARRNEQRSDAVLIGASGASKYPETYDWRSTAHFAAAAACVCVPHSHTHASPATGWVAQVVTFRQIARVLWVF